MTVAPKYVGNGLYKVKNHMNHEFMFIKEIQIDSKNGSIGYKVCFDDVFQGIGIAWCANPHCIICATNYSTNYPLMWVQAIDLRKESIRSEMELNRMDLEFVELAEILE